MWWDSQTKCWSTLSEKVVATAEPNGIAMVAHAIMFQKKTAYTNAFTMRQRRWQWQQKHCAEYQMKSTVGSGNRAQWARRRPLLYIPTLQLQERLLLLNRIQTLMNLIQLVQRIYFWWRWGWWWRWWWLASAFSSVLICIATTLFLYWNCCSLYESISSTAYKTTRQTISN